MNKFKIGDRLYCYNINMQNPLVTHFVVNGVIKNDEGIFYTADRNMWIKEEYLFESRRECYRHMLTQAENEMHAPEAEHSVIPSVSPEQPVPDAM